MQPPDDLRWRCLRARPKGEHLAAQHLRAAGFEAFSPRIRHQKKTTRGRIWFVEAMFPGYLFCRYSVQESLRHVLSTAFVSSAMTFMHDAAAVPDELIDSLRAEFDEKEIIFAQHVGHVLRSPIEQLQQLLVREQVPVATDNRDIRAALLLASDGRR